MLVLTGSGKISLYPLAIGPMKYSSTVSLNANISLLIDSKGSFSDFPAVSGVLDAHPIRLPTTSIKNRTCILLDDIADSAGTLCNAAKAIKKKGAKDIAAYITHGVFSGNSMAKISKSPIKRLVVTDSIEPLQSTKNSTKINILSVATLLSEAIKRISSEKSVSVLFD